MSMGVIFKIAAVGLLTAVVNVVLEKAGRSDVALAATLAGLVIVLLMALGLVAELFSGIQAIFGAYY